MKTNSGSKSEGTSSLAEAIAAHRFVAKMKPEHLSRLVDVAMFKQFKVDEIIFREGDRANRFYLICQGKIALETSRDNEAAPLIQMLCEDEVLGWAWLFPPYYWHFTARAVEPAKAIFFYGTRLREECDDDPAFGYDLMKRVAAVVIKRLQISRAQSLQLQLEASRRVSPN